MPSGILAGFLAVLLPVSGPASAIAEKDSERLDEGYELLLQVMDDALGELEQREQFDEDPQQRAEGYRLILQKLVDAVRVSATLDPMAPSFSRAADIAAKAGMDNPDTEYRFALIDGNERYRITGQLRSGRTLFLQSIGGHPGIGDAGPGDIIDTLGSATMAVDEDGRFTVDLAAERPEGAVNWLKLEPRAGTVLARLTDATWKVPEHSDWLLIERLCSTCPTPPMPRSPDSVARDYEAASASLKDRMKSWLGIADRIWENVPRNSFGPVRETPNGLAGQFSAWGTFELERDEALVINVPASDAPYQGIQLGTRWFTSIDYRTRQSSLTSQQAHADTDGMLRFVVAHRDPGVWNWLDTEEHREGLIMLRWQGASAMPQSGPVGQVVAFDDIAETLPEGTRMASPEERREAIRHRMEVIDRRFQ